MSATLILPCRKAKQVLNFDTILCQTSFNLLKEMLFNRCSALSSHRTQAGKSGPISLLAAGQELSFPRPARATPVPDGEKKIFGETKSPQAPSLRQVGH